MEYRASYTVEVRLYSGKVVTAKVCSVSDTVAGVKVRISYGSVVNTVDAGQVLRVVSRS